ncbi:MAG: translation initiation factor IF-2 [Oscillospiraceae bacterium]|jgi:translation initiation factor IF-2|nr:translation initiation factor IF-2 [Oscillospiraceae bacterium]
MLEKIRVKEVASALGVTNKEITDLLMKYFGGTVNLNSVMKEDWLNIVFEKFTMDYAVTDNFAAFYQAGMEGQAKRRAAQEEAGIATEAESEESTDGILLPPTAEAKEEILPIEAEPVIASAAESEPKAEAEGQTLEPKAPEPVQKETAPLPVDSKPQQEEAPAVKEQEIAAQTPTQKDKFHGGKQQPTQAKKQKTDDKKQKKPAGPAPAARSKDAEAQRIADAVAQALKANQGGSTAAAGKSREAKVVDTRGTSVDLDKFSDRYETLAGPSAASGKRAEQQQATKQKLTQKSKTYKKQGMRSSKHETESQRLRRIEAERARKPQLVIKVGDEITVTELAMRMKRTAAEVVKKLFVSLGMMATANDNIDFDTAELVASELGVKVEREVIVTIEERIMDTSEDTDANLQPRDPVVVVMGHVDHGKTSLLDAIRDSGVAETEAGGITQHIGAYRVGINGKEITFLDTPGHAAFTAMRARGAQATDIAILVVAANDGIMPQTIEAIHHAKAAGVSIVVAINKIDLPGADPDKVKQQLTEYELVPEEWGGDTICVPVSAKTREGIEDLLESVLLVAEVKELRANPDRAAHGVVIEARMDKGRGPIATLLVQNGTLHSGDAIVAGSAVGHVRVMTDDKGNEILTAGPSVPVEIAGLAEVPEGGDIFDAVTDERLARELVEQRKYAAKEDLFQQQEQVTLETLFDSLKDSEKKDLNIIVKADVQGSAEAVKQNLVKLTNEEVRVRVIHDGVGAVSDNDVMLANASHAVIIGFNVTADPIAAVNAQRDGIDIRTYRVIYDMIDDVQTAIKGMLKPKYREVPLGRMEVRQLWKISNNTVIGGYVSSGKAQRGALVRVTRDGVILADDKIESLRRFKDDVKEVNTNYECGAALENFSDLKEGDILEMYIMEEYRD